jgi:hypothetical protein
MQRQSALKHKTETYGSGAIGVLAKSGLSKYQDISAKKYLNNMALEIALLGMRWQYHLTNGQYFREKQLRTRFQAFFV